LRAGGLARLEVGTAEVVDGRVDLFRDVVRHARREVDPADVGGRDEQLAVGRLQLDFLVAQLHFQVTAVGKARLEEPGLRRLRLPPGVYVLGRRLLGHRRPVTGEWQRHGEGGEKGNGTAGDRIDGTHGSSVG